ncbi:S9 family peptidase [candidate division WOR-3 bacterium]|nr:S9 family peptidase [candidate division WOR-3 bacterium]
MPYRNIILYLVIIFLTLKLFASIPGEEKVIKILKDVDEWITTDTTRMMEYIQNENRKTINRLMSSKFYESTKKDLSFLLSIDFVSSPQIDNTGRIYYFMRLTGETDALFYTDTPMGFPHQLSPNNWSEEGLKVAYYLVHPSGDYLLAMVDRYGDELFDIYRFNRDGSFESLLVDSRIEFTAPEIKNKDEFFLIINDHKNRYLALYSMVDGSIDTLYTEEEYFSPIDYHDGKILCIRWFSFSESQLFTIDEKSLEMGNITDRGLYHIGRFTKAGEVLTVTPKLSKPGGFPVFALIKKDKEMKLIYDPGLDMDDYTFMKEKGIIVTSLNKHGYSKLVAFDLKGKELNVPLMGIGVIYDSYTGALYSNDFGDVVSYFTSPITPPSIYLFKVGEKEKKKIADVATFGFDFSNIEVKVIHYPSTDGTMIPSLLYIPENAKKDGNNPAIVSYHGGPPSQSRPYFQRNIAFALSRGIILMLPNVRGSTGYGPEWEMADNGEGRFQALEDAMSALNYLVNEKWSNPDKIAIWGGSYGGYTVNYLAVKYPEKFACAISDVGVSDVDYDNTHGDITFQKGWEIEYGPIGSELTHKLSPIFYSMDLKKPMLITTGAVDPRVVASDPRRFSWLLNKIGKDILYYEEVEAGHGSFTKSQIIDEYTRLYTFMMDHISK